jgi:hypothetical protein
MTTLLEEALVLDIPPLPPFRDPANFSGTPAFWE